MRLIECYEEYLETRARVNKVVLFGASNAGIFFVEEYRFYEDVSYFCDNDEKKWNGQLLGKEIFPPSKLLDDINDVVVIITSAYYKDICRQLKDMGILYVYSMQIFRFRNLHTKGSLHSRSLTPKYVNDGWFQGNSFTEPTKVINSNKDKIKKVRSLLSDNESVEVYDIYLKKRKYCYCDYSEILDEGIQYFDRNILNFSDNEVFVDAGCYDGQTAVDFAEIMKGKFEKIYSFEADKFLFSKCRHTLSHDKNINGKFEFIPLGVSNKNGSAKLTSIATSSKLDENGMLEIELCKMDDKIRDRVSFIKMDIEGSELKALEGSRYIIETYKPKLAISIYHKVEDLWQIPLYINQLVPEYKFYVRHYFTDFSEFILYATI